jgi:hypothetical protein
MQMPQIPPAEGPGPIYPLAPQAVPSPPPSWTAQVIDAAIVLIACLAYTAIGIVLVAVTARLTHLWPCVLVAVAGWLTAGVLAAFVLIAS